MKKFTIYNLQFTIKILLLFYILHFTFYIPTALAVDSTPSADIKTKLEQLKREIASKAAELKKEVDKKLTNKAYVGKIKTKSAQTLTLASKNGSRIVTLNQDTEFISNIKGRKYSQKLIAEEDYIVSLGDIDENQVLTAKELILLPAPTSQPKIFLWGQVLSISDQLITLKTRNLKNVSVSLDQKVKLNDFVILTGIKGKNDIFEANFVYIIPQGGILRPKKIATPSASPK